MNAAPSSIALSEFGDKIVLGILKEAQSFYEHEDLKRDFMVSIEGMNLYFGVKNRLGWSPSIGFFADFTRCTPTFLIFNSQKSAIRGAV